MLSALPHFDYKTMAESDSESRFVDFVFVTQETLKNVQKNISLPDFSVNSPIYEFDGRHKS